MPEIEALAVSATEDLSLLSQYLHQQGVKHRIIEQLSDPAESHDDDELAQRVLVARQEDCDTVQALYRDIRSGKIRLVVPDSGNRGQSNGGMASLLEGPAAWFSSEGGRYPVVLSGIVLSILGGLLYALDKEQSLVRYFTFFDVQSNFGVQQYLPLNESLAKGQFWRLFTPVFLHLGLMHLAFNMLWFWELGRRIEVRMGSVFFLLLVLVLGIGSNAVQGVMTQTSLFGGMSGVIYGLLGFCWIWDLVNPKSHFDLPPGIVGFMLVWMLLCVAGLITALGFGNIANAAHVSGLVNGCLLGALAGWYFRGHELPTAN